MAILVDENTKVLIQGITGSEGRFHGEQMLQYGTKVAGGVTPGKGGQTELGVPVFNTMREAVERTGATASVIFVPAAFSQDAILESIDAGIDVTVTISDGIPTQDMIEACYYLRQAGKVLIGPNCPGIVSVGKCKMGIMPGHIFAAGPVGVVSRSGTLTYEVVAELTKAGLGQTTCIGIGGDPILGSRFIDLLPRFEADSETKCVVMIGEIGGSDEEIAAEYIKNEMKTPVVAFISGRSAPPGKRMGHAGAIISGRTGTPESKVEALTGAGVPIADTTNEIPDLVKKALRET
jgi:succinyl-CoA synthetase alpha subunit